ncbi:hypothetical protein D3C75_740340 [compost metagenome]
MPSNVLQPNPARLPQLEKGIFGRFQGISRQVLRDCIGIRRIQQHHLAFPLGIPFLPQHITAVIIEQAYILAAARHNQLCPFVREQINFAEAAVAPVL